MDASGNSSTATQLVTVTYNTTGFLSPLKGNGIYKLGRVLPVKFQLSYANATLVGSEIVRLQVQLLIAGELSGDPIDVQSSSEADTGSIFRYGNSQYIYNLNTSGFVKGSYRLSAVISNGSVVSLIDISLK